MTGAADTGFMGRKRARQMRYLSQAIQLEEAVNPHIMRATMTVVSLAVLAFIGWAALTNVNEVARMSGEIIPYGSQQMVQHFEGGIISAIHVKDGDVVKQDQILITLSDASIREDRRRAISKQDSLELQIERLRAYLEMREPDFSRFKTLPDAIIADQMSFFNGMRDAREKEAQVIRDQIAQKQQLLSSYQAAIDTAQQDYKITSDIYERRAALNRQGYASDMQLLADKKQLNDIKGRIKQYESQILMAKSEIKEYEVRLESFDAGNRDQVNTELDQILAEKEQNIQVIRKLDERIGRLDIRSPAHGFVKGLSVNTIGAVIQPGQTIMEIVPVDRRLEVRVKILPKDIGHLAIGQMVQVKFSTYDFSRYGSVQGKLDRISATTFTGENGDRYYQGFILLDKNYVGDSPENIVLPGMTVMADVITGEKTILQYLLKPIHVSLKTAFTER